MQFKSIDAQALLTSLHAGVVLHNPDTTIAYANPKALDILRLTEQQALGRDALDPMWRFLDGNKVPLAIEDYPVARVLQTKKPVNNQEIGIVDSSINEITWVLVNAYPEFGNEKEISQVVVTFIDITADKIEIPFEASLNSLSQQVAIISDTGFIQWVNSAWKTFSQKNGGTKDKTWKNVNYLGVCDAGAKCGDGDSNSAQIGIKSVISGDESEFYFEYPCNSQTEQRWFLMRVRPLEWGGAPHFVISHENITTRKLAELKVEELAITDGLTGIANRRYFDTFLENEWLRARRLSHPVSLLLLDIDFFKPYNDNYGHAAGDECLRQVGDTLKSLSNRPDDLAARFGGEEFAIVLGNTELEAACKIAEKVRLSIQNLNIPHAHATDIGFVTVSVGVACSFPDQRSEVGPDTLTKTADYNLYAAKKQGRNQIACIK